MLLEVMGISKSFGGIRALHEVGFKVERGSIFALIGPNGAGKTTIFNLITGALQPDSGSITFNKKPLGGLKPHQIAACGVTRTFQNLQLFNSMTVLENVMTGAYLKGRQGFLQALFSLPEKNKEEKRFAREAAALIEEIGLAEYINTPAELLPFGQQRLLEIARALASDPQLILLDEPAAGLNETEAKSLVAFLKKLKNQGTTMLLIEHDMETVMEVADRVLVLNVGTVIAEGTPVEIQSNPEVIKAYLGEDDQIA